MRYVSSITPPLAKEIGDRRIKAVSQVKPAPHHYEHEHAVDTEHLPRPTTYAEERRKAQRRITNQPVLIDRRSGIERRRYNLFRHIDEEA